VFQKLNPIPSNNREGQQPVSFIPGFILVLQLSLNIKFAFSAAPKAHLQTWLYDSVISPLCGSGTVTTAHICNPLVYRSNLTALFALAMMHSLSR
jgi:hypothetical protein